VTAADLRGSLSGVLPADVRTVTAHRIGGESSAGPIASNHRKAEAGLLRRGEQEFTSFDPIDHQT
jgi:hypothetical protein